jgi:hypothetical protein
LSRLPLPSICLFGYKQQIVYRNPLYQILDKRMLEVCLGSARYVETVPGQKTDIPDCQRLQYLRFPAALGVSGSTAEE